jgi:fermentation-respiration switch protein FrsA (DUF1100 family)
MKLAALAVALGSLIGAILLVPLQRRFIYFPTRTLSALNDVLPGAENVDFGTDDGLRLEGWFVPPRHDGRSVTVVVFNGNGGNRSDRVPLARALSSHGYGVLLFDYRGYAQNPGSPSQDGLEMDGLGAVTYLSSRGDVDEQRIVYFGESLGAAVAISTANQVQPAVLVLRSPFTSLPDVASTHLPFLPMSVLLKDLYPNEDAIRSVDVPVLVVAGSEDRTVPLEQSQRVFRAAQGPKAIVVISGADHNDVRLSSGQQLVGAVSTFVNDTLTQEGGNRGR